MTHRRASQWLAVALTVLMALSALTAVGVTSSAAASSSPGTNPVAPDATAAAPATLTATGAASPSSIAPPPEPLDASASATTAEARGAAVVSALSADGVSPRDVYLPDYSGISRAGTTNGHVNLTYTTSPAPYGIGDFGLRNVSGTVTPYVTQTTSLNATFSSERLLGYAPDISGPDEYGVQLNAVLNNVTLFGQTGYQFWTQNVFDYTPSNESIQFVSNIWNFSSPTAELTCNVFYAAGGNNECPEFYYGISSPIPASYPYNVSLWLNSSLNQGRDEVTFNYTVSSGLGDFAGGYDYAIFNSLAAGGDPSLTPAPVFVANGFQDGPLGLPDDFELTLGGPGGGSNFDVFDAVSTYMTLTYLNSTSGEYQNVDSAYNVGGETGETSVGVTSDWAQFAGCSNCASLSDGPSFQYGLWNVSGGPPKGEYFTDPWFLINTNPMTAFVFIAPGNDVTNLSEFQWAPDNLLYSEDGYELPLGNYTVILLAAEYDPQEFSFDLVSTCHPCTYNEALTYDGTTGVYTPLWALNETAVAYISSGIDSYGNYELYNNQYGPIGQTPCYSGFGCYYFPWFGAFNDWMFPVFPGIYLYDVDYVDIVNPPSFATNFPPGPSYQAAVSYFGLPTSNDLQIVAYDSEYLQVLGGTIGGWWPAASFFGPSQSMASLQFWNVSDSLISGVSFDVGGMGVFLYGGSYNTLFGNTFTTFVPSSPNPYATTAAYYGAVGVVDTDWGDASLYGADAYDTCDVCDVVFNNIFDTEITATSLYTDPYTGLAPNQYPYGFSQAYNGPYTPGVTNILGGDYIGGNYWWDYGLYYNPYNDVPYVGYNPLPLLEFGDPPAYICESIVYLCDYGGGDFYPLTPTPIYSVTFEEVGLPLGTVWGVGTPVDGSASPLGDLESGMVYNETAAPGTVTLAGPVGTYDYIPYSANTNFAAADGTFTVVNGTPVVTIDFEAAYTLTVTATGLPSGAEWSVEVTNAETSNSTEGNTSSLVVYSLLPGSYLWYVETSAPGYLSIPGIGSVSIARNTTLTVPFVGEYTLTVTESGLPSGTTWSFVYQTTDYFGFASTNAASNPITNVPGLTFNWSASAVGYVATPTGGQVTVSGDTSLSVTFVAANATGTLSGTLSPSGGTLWVDGVMQTVGSGGAFSIVLSMGIHSVEVTASGYAPYFNNVTVAAGQTTQLTIALTPTSSPANTSGVGTLGWILVAVLGVVVAVLLVTTLLFARRGRQPPPVAPFAPPPAVASPPAPPPPVWQEPPPPSSGS